MASDVPLVERLAMAEGRVKDLERTLSRLIETVQRIHHVVLGPMPEEAVEKEPWE
jgi:hypothetical protein